jgi:hypothetical protein
MIRAIDACGRVVGTPTEEAGLYEAYKLENDDRGIGLASKNVRVYKAVTKLRELRSLVSRRVGIEWSVGVEELVIHSFLKPWSSKMED